MKGSVYKRCKSCGRSVSGRSCSKCGTTGSSWAYRMRVGKGPDGA